MKKLLIGLMVAFLSACMSTPEEMAAYKQRYVFDDLPSVDSIPEFRIDSWQAIDDYALVVNTRGGVSYLLILNTFLPEIDQSLEIMISSSDGVVRAGFDNVRTRRQPYMRSSIHTIYRINDDQIPAIEAKIKNAEMPEIVEAPKLPEVSSADEDDSPQAVVAESYPATSMPEETEDAVEEDDAPGFFERIRERMEDFGSQPDEPMRPRR